MKNQNSILKLFKGCALVAYDLIDGVTHVFVLRSRTGGRMRYRIDEPDGKDIERAIKYGMAHQCSREYRQEEELRRALSSMVTPDTQLNPQAMAYLKATRG